MKTFMGNVPCVPLPTVVDALDKQGHGGKKNSLSSQDVEALKKVIGMDIASCSTQCTPALWSCLSSASGTTLAEKMNGAQSQTCLKESLACYSSCIAK